MLHYCKKCGRIIEIDAYDIRKNFNCDCCNSTVELIPNIFLDEDLECCFKDKNAEQQFIDECVKTSPEFDQYLFDHRDEILAKKSAEFNAKMEHGKAVLEEQARTPKCPSCGSSNISKIGIVGRAVSFKLIGFASSKIGKTHKCNNCGAMW